MVRTLYQIKTSYDNTDDVFHSDAEAQKYIDYLEERSKFEFHEQAHSVWFAAHWTDELTLWDSADEAIADYIRHKGEPVSGEERYKVFKQAWDEVIDKKPRKIVDLDEYERFKEWQNSNQQAETSTNP